MSSARWPRAQDVWRHLAHRSHPWMGDVQLWATPSPLLAERLCNELLKAQVIQIVSGGSSAGAVWFGYDLAEGVTMDHARRAAQLILQGPQPQR